MHVSTRFAPRTFRSSPSVASFAVFRATRNNSAPSAAEAARLGVRYARIRIADQRTRWGSCSRTGTLSFNWRLVLAPHPVLEYAAVHELCHLVVSDHSPGFWQVVERARPGYREERRWLRDHGHELLAYTPANRP